MKDILFKIAESNPLVVAFVVVAVIMLLSNGLAKLIHQKRMASAIAIIIGLILAYVGGRITGGEKGISDVALFSGMGLLGGSMFRDFAIISTAYGADLKNLKSAGLVGVVGLLAGIFSALVIGALVAFAFGYRDPVDMATIAGGTMTFVVGPVTGTALGASSEVIALSIAAGVVKSILIMILTPLMAKMIHLDNPTSAMVYGGLMGTTSGVAGGLAATDPDLVPYGAMTATFYTGLGSLLCPSVGYFLLNLIF
ncbi:MAG: malonate transporter subunit MadM [Tissierellia bacterium]|nr:malonate transporter subunit MadM [Tissierellia bacterium]